MTWSCHQHIEQGMECFRAHTKALHDVSNDIFFFQSVIAAMAGMSFKPQCQQASGESTHL
jgi:hypothetical protein